jgi:DNA-binding response OmpR family regulator
MLEWLEAALAGQGMSCRCARDVEEAEAAAEMRRPALILAEAERRNMTYLQSSPDLRDIPVVLLTSDDSVGENGDGAVGILKKPFAIADVVARVNALRDRSGSFHTP